MKSCVMQGPTTLPLVIQLIGMTFMLTKTFADGGFYLLSSISGI